MVVLRSDPDSEYLEAAVAAASISKSTSVQSTTTTTTNIYNYDEVPENTSWASTIPVQKGLYNPEYEKDNCGVGMFPSFFFSFSFLSLIGILTFHSHSYRFLLSYQRSSIT